MLAGDDAHYNIKSGCKSSAWWQLQVYIAAVLIAILFSECFVYVRQHSTASGIGRCCVGVKGDNTFIPFRFSILIAFSTFSLIIISAVCNLIVSLWQSSGCRLNCNDRCCDCCDCCRYCRLYSTCNWTISVLGHESDDDDDDNTPRKKETRVYYIVAYNSH